MDLHTDYLGLALKNPLVPSASPLSRSLDTARRLEDAGAAAVVMYSLFEEEITADELLFEQFRNQHIDPDQAAAYLPNYREDLCYLDNYLQHLTKLKDSLGIPIIASLNANTPGGWVEHAQKLEQAGADALELNVYHIAANTEDSGTDVEQRYLSLLKDVKQAITIPVALKLSAQFSAPANFIAQLEKAGADGVVLFNRFFQPSIDLDRQEVSPELTLSTSADSLLAMRWIAILYGRVSLSLGATGGAHTAEDALRLLLAGSDAVQMAAALIENGPEYLGEILRGIEDWMEAHEYVSINQLKGSLSQKHAADPASYERANYVRLIQQNR